MTDRLTEEEAAKLWQRAAQLQADALKRADDRDEDEGERPRDDDQGEGYALAHVREAAIEAGIAAEYLDAALTDVRAEQVIQRESRSGRISRTLLGAPPDAITVRRVIEAPPRTVLKAMERVFARDVYNLSLTDRQGDPLNGGLLTFKIEGASFVATEGFTGQASAADLREVLVTLRSADDGRDTTEMVLRGPVGWAHGVNASVGSVMVGTAGALGLGLGWLSSAAIATSLLGAGPVAAPVLAAITAVVTTGSTGVAGGLGVQGLRAIYNYQLRKGRTGLESLLSVVAVEAQGGWALDAEPAIGKGNPDGLLGNGATSEDD